MAQQFDIELSDGTTVGPVTPTIQDSLAFESALRKHRHWGNLAESPIRAVAFRAWSAAKRAGLVDMTFDQFVGVDGLHAIDVVNHQPADDADDELDDVEEVEGLGEDIPADQYTS